MHVVRIGVIGAGQMGALFARLVVDNPLCELAGIADPVEERVGELGSRFGVAHHADYHDLLARQDMEAVVIATPEHAHLEPALAAIAAGQHLLIEKPLASNSADARRIVEAADRAGVTLMVGHTLRFDQQYGAAYKAVRAGQLGELVHLAARRNTSRGDAQRIAGRVSITMYLGSHSVDILQWIVGSPIIEVTSRGVCRAMAPYGVDDTVISLLEFANGAIGSLENSWIRPNGAATRKIGSSLVLMGTQGAMAVETMTPGTMLYQDQRGEPFVAPWSLEPTTFGRMSNIYSDELHHFVDVIDGRSQLVISSEQALSAVLVCEAIEQSVKTGQRISIQQDATFA
jgi:predicted dehydrogenase